MSFIKEQWISDNSMEAFASPIIFSYEKAPQNSEQKNPVHMVKL